MSLCIIRTTEPLYCLSHSRFTFFKSLHQFCFSGYIKCLTCLHVFEYPTLLCSYVIGVGYAYYVHLRSTIKTITITYNQTFHSKACSIFTIIVILFLVFTNVKILSFFIFLFFKEFSFIFRYCCLKHFFVCHYTFQSPNHGMSSSQPTF